MSYQRRAYLAHVVGLVFLVAQVLLFVLNGSGATRLPWWVVLMPTLAGVAYLACSFATYYTLTARDRVQRRVWRRFDYDDKGATAPPSDEHVWVIEDFYYEGLAIGWFDGYTFRVRGYGDDCKVSWWAPITYPDPPARWKRDRARWEADEDAQEEAL